MEDIERRAMDLIHSVMKERGLKHRRFHLEDTREDSFVLEATCRALELYDHIEEELQDFRRIHQQDLDALNRAITALIKISEPRVGGGQWAADVASQALDSLTCASLSGGRSD